MKILYYTNIPSPYKILFLNQLANDNEITVIFDGKEGEYRNKNWYSETDFLFKPLYLKAPYINRINKVLHIKFDIVIIGNYATIPGGLFIFLLHIKKIPFLLCIDGGIAPSSELFFIKSLKHFFISKAERYYSPSKNSDKYLLTYGAKKENIYRYPFSSIQNKDLLNSPLLRVEKNALKKKYNIHFSRVFISVGSFIKRKGFDLLINTIPEINCGNDVGFIIVGGGPDKKHLEDMIHLNNISNVILVDFLDKNTLFDYYKMSDCFIFPSKEDIWGLVINEAMACGLPIISSDKVNSSLELLDSKYLYNVYDHDSLKTLIEYFAKCSDQALYEIGLNNLQKIKNYTIENMAYTIDKLLKENTNGR